MKLDVKITGFEEVKVQLRYMEEKVADLARKQMHRSAERIVKEAQLNAPVDKHNLEKSIHIEKAYGTRGRLNIDVVAGGVVDGVDVDQYVLEMHEFYENYEPGPATLEKMRQNPDRTIGSHFLTRAAAKEEPRLNETMIAVIKTVDTKL